MLRKTVFITGASGGIGGATALKFAQNGYNVALTYRSGDTKALEKQISALGVEAKSYQLDQTNYDQICKVVKAVFSDFEYVDAVVLNSGKAEPSALLVDKTVEDIDEILNINLRGTILLARECLKYMIKARHGSIVTISSILGVSGGSCEAVYSATKAGVIGLTKALASEVAPCKIRVNSVAPGFIDTKMSSQLPETAKKRLIEITPLSRVGEPEDVANLVYFLSSDQASFITGECVTVTGGVTKF